MIPYIWNPFHIWVPPPTCDLPWSLYGHDHYRNQTTPWLKALSSPLFHHRCFDFVVLPFFHLIIRFMFTVFFYLIHFLLFAHDLCLFFFSFLFTSHWTFSNHTQPSNHQESIWVITWLILITTHIHCDSYLRWLLFTMTLNLLWLILVV